MRNTYINTNGVEVRRNANEKSAYFKIRDVITSKVLFKSKDEDEMIRELHYLKGMGYLLSVE